MIKTTYWRLTTAILQGNHQEKIHFLKHFLISNQTTLLVAVKSIKAILNHKMSIKQFKNLKKRIKKVWRLLPKRTFYHLTLSRSKGLKMKDLEFSKLCLEKFKIIMINTVNIKLINLSNCKNQTKNKIQLIKAKTI